MRRGYMSIIAAAYSQPSWVYRYIGFVRCTASIHSDAVTVIQGDLHDSQTQLPRPFNGCGGPGLCHGCRPVAKQAIAL